MKIHFWAIGKSHDPMLKDAIDDFSNRIQHYFPINWKVFPAPKINTKKELKSAESKMIQDALQAGDFVVALDENGKEMTSVQLSEFLEQQSFKSVKNVIFVIGGAFGFDEAFLSQCHFKWSLSKLTFPHQLVRLILAEQIYRACTILRNEKYHHS